MKRVIYIGIILSVVLLLTSCPALLSRIRPPDWIIGTWVGLLETENKNYQYVWNFTEKNAEYTIFEENQTIPANITYDCQIYENKYKDEYKKDDKGQDQYIIEVFASTMAPRKYTFTRIDEETVELLEVDEWEQYHVILTRKQ